MRAVMTVALCSLFVGVAAGQSVWLTGPIPAATATAMTTPPALVFDNQDRPQVVCDAGYSLQHTAGDAAGVIPNWSAWVSTDVSDDGPGQIYLACSGNTLYLANRPRVGTSYPLRAAAFDGTSWQPYALSLTLANPYGLVIDGGGQPQWLIHTEKLAYADNYRWVPTWGYYLASRDGAGTEATVPVALGTGGGFYVDFVDNKTLCQGGQAQLDRFGNLHTIQYCPRGVGTLLYARGPLAGPFEVSDYLEADWTVKLGRPSITVDAAGMPHIAYTQQWPDFGLKHLEWSGSAWVSEWIERGGNMSGYVGTFPTILIDLVGVLHVVYADPMRGLLKHAAKRDGHWEIEVIGSVGMMGSWQVAGMLAAAMDSQGGIGVVYWDAANGLYKYAYRLPLDQAFVPQPRQPPREEASR